jgi:hypothetical protein
MKIALWRGSEGLGKEAAMAKSDLALRRKVILARHSLIRAQCAVASAAFAVVKAVATIW